MLIVDVVLESLIAGNEVEKGRKFYSEVRLPYGVGGAFVL